MALRCLTKNFLQRAYIKNGHMGASTRAAAQMEEFWKKNQRLDRPLSPHLSIYSPQLTSMLSITNRITGCILTAVLYVGPIAYLCGSLDYGGYLEIVKGLGTPGVAFVNLTKVVLASSMSYHFWGGIRHLMWDNAKGFQLSQVYTSGYVLILLTIVTTIALMCL